MSALPEQFSAASKSQAEAQLDLLKSFGACAFDGAARLMALNLDTGRAVVDRSSAALKQLADVRDPRDLFALANGAPDFDKVFAYGREWFSIVADVQANLFKPVAAAAPRLAAAPARAAAAPAPAPAPAQAQAPVAQAAPEAPEHRSVKPSKKPVVAVKPEADAAPVAEAKPIAKAAGTMAGKQLSAKPSAASIPAGGAKVLPQVKPVEASPPPAVFQQDLLAPKRGKKR